MDHLLELNFEKKGLLWLEGCPVVEQRSAFVPYACTATARDRSSSGGGGNIHKRMMELLRLRRRSGKLEPERERCFRHMINERMRRERHKDSFSSLHAMLPHGTKNDKNSIMQMAAREILVMRRYKEELRRRNKEMEASFITFNTSGIDSLLELLKSLPTPTPTPTPTMGSHILSIRSHFSNQQLVAQLLFQNKIPVGLGRDLQNAVRERLDQVDKKLQGHCHQASLD